MVSGTMNTMGSLKRVYPKKPAKEQSRVTGWQRPRGMQKRNALKIYLQQMARGSK
jgi:hypothetical protein